MFLFAVTGSLIGQMLVIYAPPLQQVFQTEGLYVTGSSCLSWVSTPLILTGFNDNKLFQLLYVFLNFIFSLGPLHPRAK